MIYRYSAIDTAHRCLARYKYQYVDKIEVKGLPGLDLEFGIALHAALNACLEKGDPLAVFLMYWDSIRGREFIESQFNWAQMKDMGEVFLTRFQRLHAKHFDPFQMETRLSGLIGTYEFEGTPDFVGLYKGVPSIVDFKTSNYAYTKDKILMNEQMPLYSQLVKQNSGYEVKQLVYYVFIKRENRIQTITTPLTKKLLDGAIRNVIMVCNDLDKRTEFPRNPNSCTMGKFRCPYWDKCYGELNDE